MWCESENVPNQNNYHSQHPCPLNRLLDSLFSYWYYHSSHLLQQSCGATSDCSLLDPAAMTHKKLSSKDAVDLIHFLCCCFNGSINYMHTNNNYFWNVFLSLVIPLPSNTPCPATIRIICRTKAWSCFLLALAPSRALFTACLQWHAIILCTAEVINYYTWLKLVKSATF